MKYLLVISVFIGFSVLVQAQDVPFERSAFPGQRKELRVARKQMQKGIKLASKGEVERKEALDLLLSAHAFNPNNSRLNYTIGKVLFNSSDPHLSLPYFEKAYSLNQKVAPDIFFLLGRAYHLNHYFELAVSFYQEYARVIDGKEKKRMLPEVTRLSHQATFGDSLLNHPTAVFIDNMGKGINSVFPEYGPVLMPDGQTLWFTSRRQGSTGGETDRSDQFFEDIYYLEKIDGAWSEPNNPGEPLNTPKHESTAGYFPAGKYLVIRRLNPSGDLFVAEGNMPKEVVTSKLSKRINSRDDETTITFSPDSTRVWFVSTRKGGYGGKDIWMCQAKPKGGWRKAVNAGPQINTQGNEESPFISADGKTLYFSSDRQPGMGGFDVFRTNFEGSVYSVPVNMGYPVNSAADDLFFSLDTRGRNGFMASSRMGGSGSFDLYRVRIVDGAKPLLYQTDSFQIALSLPGSESPELIPALKPYEPVILIRGTITDVTTGAPVSGSVVLFEQPAGQQIGSMQSSPSGAFLMNVATRQKYLLTVQARGYFPKMETVDVSQMEQYASVQVPVKLVPAAPGAIVELRNTRFPANDSILPADAAKELELLASFLKMHENFGIRILGFATTPEDGVLLPSARANAVYEYLISKGIYSGRMDVDQTTPLPGNVTPTPAIPVNYIRIVINQI